MTDPTMHYGNDQMGAPAEHAGIRQNCPAPECGPDLELNAQWGVWCQHGEHIVEADPDTTDPDGGTVGRLVDPWPCTADGCTAEAFEESERAREEDYYAALNEIAADVHR